MVTTSNPLVWVTPALSARALEIGALLCANAQIATPYSPVGHQGIRHAAQGRHGERAAALACQLRAGEADDAAAQVYRRPTEKPGYMVTSA